MNKLLFSVLVTGYFTVGFANINYDQIYERMGDCDYDLCKKMLLLVDNNTISEKAFYLLTHAYMAYREGRCEDVVAHFVILDKAIYKATHEQEK